MVAKAGPPPDSDGKAEATPDHADSAEAIDNGPKDGPLVSSRRRLLKLGAYTAPVVMGTLLVSKDALAQEGSCIPLGGDCSPDGGPCIPDSPCSPDGAPCPPEWFDCLPDICFPTFTG